MIMFVSVQSWQITNNAINTWSQFHCIFSVGSFCWCRWLYDEVNRRAKIIMAKGARTKMMEMWDDTGKWWWWMMTQIRGSISDGDVIDSRCGRVVCFQGCGCITYYCVKTIIHLINGDDCNCKQTTQQSSKLSTKSSHQQCNEPKLEPTKLNGLTLNN